MLWPCPVSNCFVSPCVTGVCKRSQKCVVCVSVCVFVGVCDPADTFSLCAEEKGATPRSRCSSTNLVVTVPFIPPIGHGALWQSHVFAHWERQFLANFNRTVAHKKGRATCTGGGANPPPTSQIASSPVLSVDVCLWIGWCRIWWLWSLAECWMSLICLLFWMCRGVFFLCNMNVGCSLANLVWEVSFYCALFSQVLSTCFYLRKCNFQSVYRDTTGGTAPERQTHCYLGSHTNTNSYKVF